MSYIEELRARVKKWRKERRLLALRKGIPDSKKDLSYKQLVYAAVAQRGTSVFSARDLELSAPTVSVRYVKIILKEMIDKGKLELVGKPSRGGKSLRYRANRSKS